MNNIVLRFPNFKKKAITLSYDDGTIYDNELLGILRKYRIKCTFNLSANFLVDDILLRKGRRLIKSEAISLYNSPDLEIAMHGFNHLNLTLLPKQQLDDEIRKDIDSLSKNFSCNICGGAYPYGAFNDDVLDTLKKNGIKYCRTTLDTEKFSLPQNWLLWNPTCHHNSEKLVELTDSFLNSNIDELQLFFLWGHSYEFNDFNNWEIIENFCKKVSDNNEIWFATNGEIYSYIEAYNNLIRDMNGSVITNISNLTLFIECNGKKIVIPPNSKYSL